jgi:hypothetical protein
VAAQARARHRSHSRRAAREKRRVLEGFARHVGGECGCSSAGVAEVLVRAEVLMRAPQRRQRSPSKAGVAEVLIRAPQRRLVMRPSEALVLPPLSACAD